MVDMFSLKGKNAIVIGGSRGLGKGMAAGLAAAGAEKIIISSRSRQELDAAAAELGAIGDTQVTGIVLDIRSLAAVRAYVEDCAARLGHIDILINSAGINVRKPALDFTEQDWDQVMDTQLKFVFFMCQAVAGHMRDKGLRGKIINVGSLTSVLGFKNIVAYCAAKGGILQLTKALANELAEYGINVNAVGPGYFETVMSKPLFQDPATVKRFIERIPQKRTGLPEDLAGAAVYLASAASDYMTGQIIYVDGGWLIN
jgi:NAD(P)-dependent dehydrogenase (short-subunit alcohol dehydrogenase family)